MDGWMDELPLLLRPIDGWENAHAADERFGVISIPLVNALHVVDAAVQSSEGHRNGRRNLGSNLQTDVMESVKWPSFLLPTKLQGKHVGLDNRLSALAWVYWIRCLSFYSVDFLFHPHVGVRALKVTGAWLHNVKVSKEIRARAQPGPGWT